MGAENRNQHFIPQALQKGFAFRVSGKTAIVHVFCRDGRAFPTSTRNIGAESFFYGRDDETGIDSEIRKVAEDPFNGILGILRDTKTVSPNHVPIIANFIDSLTIRTRMLRDAVADVFQKTVGAVQETLTDKEFLAGTSRAAAAAMQSEEGLREALELPDDVSLEDGIRAKLNLPNTVPVQQVLELLKSSGSSLVGAAFRDLQPPLQLAAGKVGAEIDPKEKAKDALFKVLLQQVVGGRAESYKALRWTVVESPEQPLILGDFGACCLFEGDDAWTFPLHGTGTPRAVALPIATHLLLVGHGGEVPTVDFEAVNCAQGEMSWDFFVAAQDTERERRYQSTIGSRAELVTSDDASEMWDDAKKSQLKESLDHYTSLASEAKAVPKVGRNDPCPCGSGKKYKKCCGG